MTTFLIHFYFLIFSCILSYFDLKSYSYPLWIWFAFTILFLPLGSVNSLFFLLLSLALLSSLLSIPIGAGDFIYLASLSLFYSLQDILWIIQIGSFLGIFLAMTCRTNRLPFIPFLTIGLFVISSL
ncbi:prepilin peptidase [Streptococcus hongkongensis]